MENPPIQFINPTDIINQLDISRNSIIADFGCGSGYFSVPLAQHIGEDGKVYALDILTSALESVESKAKLNGLSNIVTKRVNLEKEGGSKFDGENVDWVILKDMLFQNNKKDIILKEARRILKKDGKMLIIEWNEKAGAFGPGSDLKISREELKKLIAGGGFKIEKEISAGDYHYGFIAAKN
ncbi:MAG: hypothetical protein A3J63_00575 [Candidatus Moranbacteria bacterium RIFCSPHIGHO2_02_FULL_40_12b]|nr:MAG: hypothetical protein A3J63_00575 [Candidatus Moranbacteria bacterium RIFCSPHIGHO2_02_FULL_40_12b]OGI22999.1 MAG: hypothetical protein A3E91_03205 [Candidatus Moranbacteria bacterium RIFCSPHIGHO2_12_FULL_40_10]